MEILEETRKQETRDKIQAEMTKRTTAKRVPEKPQSKAVVKDLQRIAKVNEQL